MVKVRRISLGVLTLALWFGQIGCNSSPARYLRRGDEFFAAGKYDDACINYRQAIGLNSGLPEGYHRLGLCEFSRGNVGTAASALRKAASLAPDDPSVTDDYADVLYNHYLTSGRPQALYDAITAAVGAILRKNPDSITGLRLHASLLYSDGKTREALQIYEKANKLSPFDLAIVLRLADALRTDDRQREAEKLATEFIARDTIYGPLHEWLVQLYLSEERFADAERILLSCVDRHQNDPQALIALAVFYRNQHRGGDAKKLMESLVARGPGMPGRFALAGDFYAAGQDWAAAEKNYWAGISDNPAERPAFLRKIGSSYLAQGKDEQALKIFNRLVSERPDDWDAQGTRISILIASSVTASRNLDDAIASAESVIRRRPADGRLLSLAGRAYALKGDSRRAETLYAAASRQDRRFVEPRIALAEIGKDRRDTAGVLRYTEEAMAVDPRDIRPRLLHAWAMIYRKDFAVAGNEMRTLQRDFPDSFDVQLQAGLLLIAERRTGSAIDLFAGLLKRAPGDRRVLAGLATAYFQGRSWLSAVQLIDRELKRDPLPEATRALLADLAEKVGAAPTALEQFKILAAIRPQSPEYRFELGKLHEAMGEKAAAVEAFESAVHLSPDDATKQGRLALAYHAAGLVPQADAAYLRSVSLDPNDAVLLNNRAYFLAETGSNPDEALRLVQSALLKNPGDPAFRDTLALSYISKKNSDNAIQILRGLLVSYQSDPVLRYHLALALVQKGDRAAAREQLELGLAKHPSPEDRAKIQALLATVRG